MPILFYVALAIVFLVACVWIRSGDGWEWADPDYGDDDS